MSVNSSRRHMLRFEITAVRAGSRCTVRGFYWRNELQVPIAQTGQSVYAGIDYGHVLGPDTASLAGTQLAGAVIGVRGNVPIRVGGLAYDVFAGTPIYKPSRFPTERITVGFQATAQF